MKSKIKSFFDKEFKNFSIYDTQRSIPNMIDGFKPSMRKVIYTLDKRNHNHPDREVKVARASAFVSSDTDYHHGEISLEGTIIGLAQDYTGSNNLNLLIPEGQFGSILSPEAGGSRYIFTYLSDNFSKLFKKADNNILEYLDSDGMKIEPRIFLPILPTVLINGSRGVGTGYASHIMNYNPKEIKKNVKNVINGKKQKTMIPWYDGFKGKIFRNEQQTIIEGCYEILNTTTIKITQLPIGVYLDKYKEILNTLQDKDIIKGYDDNSNSERWEFIISIPRTTSKLNHEKIMSTFKLRIKATENYTLWNEYDKIKIYNDPNHIIQDFVEFRLTKYEERRLKLLEIETNLLEWLNEKLKFVKYYIENHSKFAKKNKKDLFTMLEKEGFVNIDKLLSMKIYSLTKDDIDKLKTNIKETKERIKFLKKTNNKEMYLLELDELKL